VSDDRRDELLQGYLAGECSRAEVLSQAPDLSGVLDEFDRLVSRVDEAARQEEREAASGGAASPEGQELVQAFFRQRAQEAAGPGPGLRRLAPLLAAAAVVLLLAWLGATRPWSQEEDLHLDRKLVELVAPGEDGGSWDRFSFEPLVDRASLPGLSIRVRAGDGHDGEVLAESGQLTGNEWSPEDPAGWPDVITWEVLAHALGAAPRGRSRRCSRR